VKGRENEIKEEREWGREGEKVTPHISAGFTPMTIDLQRSIFSAGRAVTLNWVMSRVSGQQFAA